MHPVHKMHCVDIVPRLAMMMTESSHESPGGTVMSLEKLMSAQAKLTADLTAAVVAASKAGLGHDEIKAALESVAALIDQAD